MAPKNRANLLTKLRKPVTTEPPNSQSRWLRISVCVIDYLFSPFFSRRGTSSPELPATCAGVSAIIYKVSHFLGFHLTLMNCRKPLGLFLLGQKFKSTILTAVVAFLAYYSNFVKFFYCPRFWTGTRTGLAGVAGIRMFKGFMCVYMTLPLLPTHWV